MSKAILDDGQRYAGTEQLTDSEYYRLLSAKRCRIALEVITERSAPIPLDVLAEAVARREADAKQPSEERVERVTTSLYHMHLPKMDAFDVVDFDEDAGKVKRRS